MKITQLELILIHFPRKKTTTTKKKNKKTHQLTSSWIVFTRLNDLKLFVFFFCCCCFFLQIRKFRRLCSTTVFFTSPIGNPDLLYAFRRFPKKYFVRVFPVFTVFLQTFDLIFSSRQTKPKCNVSENLRRLLWFSECFGFLVFSPVFFFFFFRIFDSIFFLWTDCLRTWLF